MNSKRIKGHIVFLQISDLGFMIYKFRENDKIIRGYAG
jgi:hypothetical protein